MAADTEDEFQRELVDLFMQEAREWLEQIHVALDELQQGPPAERHAALVNSIVAGLTNLGGSAATINLPEVERASFSVLPFVDAIKDPQTPASAQDFLALCQQFGHIGSALTKATGISFEPEPAPAAPTPIPSLPIQKILDALHQQHRDSARPKSGRNLTELIITQLEHQVRSGERNLDVSQLEQFLDRLSKDEDEFLRTIQDGFPAVAESLTRLKADGIEACERTGVLRESLQEVSRLQAVAQQAHATPVMTFLAGLETFLSVVMQRRPALSGTRVEAVEARVRTMRASIQDWVEAGRAERAQIGRLLSEAS